MTSRPTIGRLVSGAYAILLGEGGNYLNLVMVPFIVSVILNPAVLMIGFERLEESPNLLFLVLILQILSFLFWVPLIVAVHRRIILNEAFAAGGFLKRLGARSTGLYFRAALLLGLMFALVISLPLMGSKQATPGGGVALSLIAVVAMIYVFGYLFILPAKAVKEDATWAEARSWIQGAKLNVFAALIVALVPLHLVGLSLIWTVETAVPAVEFLLRPLIATVIGMGDSILVAAILSYALKAAYSQEADASDA